MSGLATPYMLYTFMAWKGPIFLQIVNPASFDSKNKMPSGVLSKSQTAGWAYQ